MASDIGMRLGGPDATSIKFLESWTGGMFISPNVDNSDPAVHSFLRERYFENGAALFGRESHDEMEDFRRVAKIDTTDAETAEIIQYYVQRIRNYAHIAALATAEIDFAVTVPDRCSHPISTVLINEAMMKVNSMRKMSLENYGKWVFSSDVGFPPFDVTCSCRLEGIIEGVEYKR